jgi:nucleotide-binding universal stress UspA family protein
MVMIRRILCPCDFSEFAVRALDHAVALARWYGSRVHVLHAVPSLVAPMAGLPMPAPVVLEPQTRDRLLAELQEFAKPATAAGIPVDLDVVEGDPAGQIVRRAQSLPADLVVLGTHGLGGFERLVLGSVTEKVLRRSTVPVLVVPRPLAESGAPPHAHFKSILCPLDFADPAKRALTHALSLARESQARLIVLHVLEAFFDELAPEHAHFNVPEFRRYMEEDARKRLLEVVPSAVQAECHVETVLSSGKAYREILRVAHERGSDLIVMGVHGRGPLDVLLFGSTAQHVVRAAHCPVLTLRAPAGV